MSDTRCPVLGCRGKKADWHLTCRGCWAKVPPKTQAKIFKLYREAPGGDEHRLVCLTVIDILCNGVPPGSVWP